MALPRIAIVVGTTRPNRFADKPKDWIMDLAAGHAGAEFEVVDLRDYPLPFFEEARAPVYEPASHPVAQAFSSKMAEFDGYVFITAEYNHSLSGVLKNALDHLYSELGRKPAAFLGYGGVGAARAVEQLRLITVELQMAPLRNAVHIGLFELRALIQGKADFDAYPYLADSAHVMLDDLIWWTTTLRAGRMA